MADQDVKQHTRHLGRKGKGDIQAEEENVGAVPSNPSSLFASASRARTWKSTWRWDREVVGEMRSSKDSCQDKASLALVPSMRTTLLAVARHEWVGEAEGRRKALPWSKR